MKRLLVASLFLSLLGCGGGDDQAKKPAEKAPAQAAQPVVEKPKADFSGRLTGIVKLEPGAVLPLGRDPHVPGKPFVDPPAPCEKWSEADRRIVAESPETKGLSPVHLALTQMNAAPKREPVTHRLALVGCRLTPTLLGAMVGDKVEITNLSDAPLLPVLPGDPFMQAMLKDGKRTFDLVRPGPNMVSCGFGAYCGEAMIIAVHHPLYAVTNTKGEFEIGQVPLDQDVMLHAWHPLFEVTSKPVRLSKEQPTATLELMLKPKAAPPAAPAPEEKTSGKKKGAKDEIIVK